MYQLYKLSPAFKSNYDIYSSDYVVTSSEGYFYILNPSLRYLTRAFMAIDKQLFKHSRKPHLRNDIHLLCTLVDTFSVDTHPELFI